MRQFLFSPHDRETFYTFDARVYTDHPFLRGPRRRSRTMSTKPVEALLTPYMLGDFQLQQLQTSSEIS